MDYSYFPVPFLPHALGIPMRPAGYIKNIFTQYINPGSSRKVIINQSIFWKVRTHFGKRNKGSSNATKGSRCVHRCDIRETSCL